MKTGYGTIYQFEFDGTCKPFANEALYVVKGKVLILKKAYNGSVNIIPYGQVSPVEIDYPTADDDIFYPLKGSSLSFKVLGGIINMDSIISEDETEYFLEYYRGANLFWSGFVSPELCEEDIFLRYPAIEFKTIDGLGTLKNKNLTATKYPDGILNLLTVVQKSLNSIGYEYGLNVLCKLFNLNHTKTSYSTPLEQTFIYTAGLQDKNFDFKENSDLVLDTCNLLNSVVYQNYGAWYFVKVKDLAFGVNQASKFNVSGVLNTSSKQTIPTLRHGTDFLIVAEPRRKIRRFYKEVEVEYQRGDSKLINGNFNIWTGTKNEIAYTPTLDLNTGSLAETNFKFFSKSYLGGPKTYCLYDSLANRYLLGLTTTSANDGALICGPAVAINWGNGFDLNIKCPTSNPSFSISVGLKEAPGQPSFYFNFTTGNWQTSPYVFKKSVNYPAEDLEVFSFNFPFPDVIDAYDLYKYKEYTVGINLYAQSRTGFTGFQTIYEQVLLGGVGGYADQATGTWPVFYEKKSQSYIDNFKLTNPKNTSLKPPKKIVYNGDSLGISSGSSLFITDYNYSHLHTFDGTDYVTTYDGSWYERDEYDPASPPAEGGIYGINELAARNILNQYSDYRNIFTATLIGKDLQYGAIYEFPIQGILANKKFFPLSMKINERDCTAEVVLMELTSNEISASMITSRYDVNGNLISGTATESKKKNRNGVGTDLGEAGDFGTLFDRFVAFFMDDFKP
jgi:hypothetical protein